MATEKQIAANRENAQSSSGPVTPEGKAKCSHNAVKTGLTGQTVLLKTDNVEAYNQHLKRFYDKFEPSTDDERDLVQDLADTEWRLLRIVPLETGMLAIGRREFAAEFADETNNETREAMIEAKIVMAYRKDLTNLSLQHTRLRRHRDVVTQELAKQQEERKLRNRRQYMRAAETFLTAIEDPGWCYFDLEDFGSEFTLEQMFEGVAEIRCRQKRYKFPELSRHVEREAAEKEYYEKWGNQDELEEDEAAA